MNPRRLAAFLGCDCIWYLLRASTFAHYGVGQEGRSFMGEGMLKSEADLEKISDCPSPKRMDSTARRSTSPGTKGDYALVFATRIGFFQTVLGMGTRIFSCPCTPTAPLVEKILDIYFDWMEVVAERMCQLGFDIFWTTDDFAFKTGLFFSRSSSGKSSLPGTGGSMKKVSIPWFLHSDGNILEALDILIELGVAATHPNEKGAMDIRAVKQKYGDRICVIGNLDLNILGIGHAGRDGPGGEGVDPRPGARGRVHDNSGNSLASYLKPECVLAMAEAIQEVWEVSPSPGVSFYTSWIGASSAQYLFPRSKYLISSPKGRVRGISSSFFSWKSLEPAGAVSEPPLH